MIAVPPQDLNAGHARQLSRRSRKTQKGDISGQLGLANRLGQSAALSRDRRPCCGCYRSVAETIVVSAVVIKLSAFIRAAVASAVVPLQAKRAVIVEK